MSTEWQGNGRRRVEWIIERLVERRIDRSQPEKTWIWVRVAPSKEFTIKGAVGYIRRLRQFYSNSQYRLKHLATGEVLPSELFGV